MKILIIQENGRHDKNRQFRECFCMQRALSKLSHTCEVWGLGHSNYNQQLDFNSYDLIINLENYDQTNWVPDLSQVKCKKMLWAIDSHCRGQHVYLGEFKKGGYDIILQATTNFVDSNSVWFPNCYDNSLINRRQSEKQYDVGFCGNVANRGVLLNLLESSGFSFKKDIFVIGDDMVRAINSYRVHFNANIAEDINYRNFETIGCATALLTSFNPQYESLGFRDGENCFLYKNTHELLDKLDLLISNKQLREKIQNNGYHLAINQHTYDHRAKQLIDIFNNI